MAEKTFLELERLNTAIRQAFGHKQWTIAFASMLISGVSPPAPDATGIPSSAFQLGDHSKAATADQLRWAQKVMVQWLEDQEHDTGIADAHQRIDPMEFIDWCECGYRMSKPHLLEYIYAMVYQSSGGPLKPVPPDLVSKGHQLEHMAEALRPSNVSPENSKATGGTKRANHSSRSEDPAGIKHGKPGRRAVLSDPIDRAQVELADAGQDRQNTSAVLTKLFEYAESKEYGYLRIRDSTELVNGRNKVVRLLEKLENGDWTEYTRSALRQYIDPEKKSKRTNRKTGKAYPNVFIDEMQDTSDPQLEVLTKVFRTVSSVQRFGDVNQSILGRGPRTAAQAFPVAGCHEVKTSLRFGDEIAAVANSVKAVGGPIEGRGDPAIAPPALLLYSDQTVEQVIARFGRWLAPLVTVEQLDRYPVKAVCAIKRVGNAKQPVGRHVRDYFPEYDDTAGKAVGGRTSVRELLRAAAADTEGAERRSGAARQAILLLLGTYGKDDYKAARSWRELVQLLSQSQLPRVRLTVLNCILGEHDVSTEANTRSAISRVLLELDDLVDPGALSTAIPDAWLLDGGASAQASKTQPNLLTVQAAGVEIPVHIATIAAVKGETHLATLVLESCFDKAYDLKSVLPFLCGDESAAAIADDTLKSQVMNVFVASTRPRRLLAFAMHTDRASPATQTKLTARGWSVLDWSAPEGSLAGTPTT